jgi:hypothetical protein
LIIRVGGVAPAGAAAIGVHAHRRREYGSVLTFRYPDGRQFEMFYRERHP